MITFVQHGNFSKTNSFFEKMLNFVHLGELDKYGKMGVEALSAATPKDTGLASSSWYYNVVREDGKVSIQWCNSDIEHGVNVAVIVQYGHATKSGSWVEGRDYINPAMRPVFDYIADQVLKEVN